MRHIEAKKPMATTISDAKAAFAAGRLDRYKPLATTGTEAVKSTCTASWGPAMRR
ncbi:hypothetical protein [Marinobacterium aestuariivivens]|uniref:Uncharacterized protein n=1 Tax=Marinobacterium aestuariivivens TaxID=1698799 RepID=A0ABW2A0G0_9GAMM